MAKFVPELDYIEADRMESHTTGELHLLHLLKSLDDEYSVYFQSHINYNHPDIVILHPHRGVLIIEVKDWNLPSYFLEINSQTEKYGTLKLKNGEARGLTTPFEQVENYKIDLFRLLSPELGFSMVRNSSVYRTVKTAVYFSEATFDDVYQLFIPSGRMTSSNNVNTYGKYIHWWTKEDDSSLINQINNLMKEDELYTPAIHRELEGIFSLSNEWIEQGGPIVLDDFQKKLAESHPGERTRVYGVAGSGKTLVIAQKAINSYLNTHKRVLILTYNITVCNYIRDKIARNTRKTKGQAGMSIRERSKAFELIHFDAFLSQLITSCGLKPIDRYKYEDKYGNLQWDKYQRAQMSLLKANSGLIEKYKTIIIDEAQDYLYAWFSFVEDYIAAEDAELFVVADEKQNIYGRQLGENRKVRMPGFSDVDWVMLKKNYRMNSLNHLLAIAFQNEFFPQKYEVDKPFQLSMINADNEGFRLFVDYTGKQDLLQMVYDLIWVKCMQEKKISLNDICILADDIYSLHKLDKYLQDRGKSTMTMFEPMEIYLECRRKSRVDEPCDEEEKKKRKAKLENDLSLLRSVKKRAFRMNPGTVKLSTIHSFKGWEIDTVILLIDKNDDAEISDELIYTAITRAKKNLIIVNNGNTRYIPFIKKNSDLISTE